MSDQPQRPPRRRPPYILASIVYWFAAPYVVSLLTGLDPCGWSAVPPTRACLARQGLTVLVGGIAALVAYPCFLYGLHRGAFSRATRLGRILCTGLATIAYAPLALFVVVVVGMATGHCPPAGPEAEACVVSFRYSVMGAAVAAVTGYLILLWSLLRAPRRGTVT